MKFKQASVQKSESWWLNLPVNFIDFQIPELQYWAASQCSISRTAATRPVSGSSRSICKQLRSPIELLGSPRNSFPHLKSDVTLKIMLEIYFDIDLRRRRRRMKRYLSFRDQKVVPSQFQFFFSFSPISNTLGLSYFLPVHIGRYTYFFPKIPLNIVWNNWNFNNFEAPHLHHRMVWGLCCADFQSA